LGVHHPWPPQAPLDAAGRAEVAAALERLKVVS
jgi:hypothetical protein